MFRRRLIWTSLFSVVLAGVTFVALHAQTPLPPVPSDVPDGDTEFYTEDDAEALNRGAIHEAFATPVDNEPTVGLIVNRQPPDPIDEVPPELKPEGENIVWISGYFSFDEELDDFVWISGMWRDVPPGRTWVPGYWHEIEGGWQWVHGYWADESAEEIVYQPEPPASQEYGPSSPSPGDNYFYIPGSWVYVDYNYSWRPGYWAPYQPNWIWVPARYIFTPRGYVYIPGYWDYLLRYRGVAYAPVHFHRYGLRRRYRPVVLIDSWEHLLLHLFVRPRFGYYTFGNYYGNRYNNFYQPWYAYHRSRGGYDPLYAHFHIRYGNDGYNRLVGWNTYFHNHNEYRPRTTYREQRNFLIQHRDTTDRSILAATSLASNFETIQQSAKTPVSFRKVELAEQTAITKSIQEIRNASLQRTRLEGRTKGFGSAKIQKPETQKFEIPKLVQQQKIPGVTDRFSNRKGFGNKSGNPALTDRKPPELPAILGNRAQAGRTLPGRNSNTLPDQKNEPSTRDPRKTDPRNPSIGTPFGNRNSGSTRTNPRFPIDRNNGNPKPGAETPQPRSPLQPTTPNNPKVETPKRTLPATRTPGKPDTSPRQPDTKNIPRTSKEPKVEPRKQETPSNRNSEKPNPRILPRTTNPSTAEPPKQTPTFKPNPDQPRTPTAPRQSIPTPRSPSNSPALKPPEKKPATSSTSPGQTTQPRSSQRSTKPIFRPPTKPPTITPQSPNKSPSPPKSSSRETSRQPPPSRRSFSKPSTPQQAPQIKQPSPKSPPVKSSKSGFSAPRSFSKPSAPRQPPQSKQPPPKSSSIKSSKPSAPSRSSFSKPSTPPPQRSAPPKSSSSKSKTPPANRGGFRQNRKKD